MACYSGPLCQVGQCPLFPHSGHRGRIGHCPLWPAGKGGPARNKPILAAQVSTWNCFWASFIISSRSSSIFPYQRPSVGHRAAGDEARNLWQKHGGFLAPRQGDQLVIRGFLSQYGQTQESTVSFSKSSSSDRNAAVSRKPQSGHLCSQESIIRSSFSKWLYVHVRSFPLHLGQSPIV
jgi:hypothetical protein